MDATPFISNSRVYFIAFLRHRKFSTSIMLAARTNETVNAVASKYIALGLYFCQISLHTFFYLLKSSTKLKTKKGFCQIENIEVNLKHFKMCRNKNFDIQFWIAFRF